MIERPCPRRLRHQVRASYDSQLGRVSPRPPPPPPPPRRINRLEYARTHVDDCIMRNFRRYQRPGLDERR